MNDNMLLDFQHSEDVNLGIRVVHIPLSLAYDCRRFPHRWRFAQPKLPNCNGGREV